MLIAEHIEHIGPFARWLAGCCGGKRQGGGGGSGCGGFEEITTIHSRILPWLRNMLPAHPDICKRLHHPQLLAEKHFHWSGYTSRVIRHLSSRKLKPQLFPFDIILCSMAGPIGGALRPSD